ncbi:YbhB/YbcL family Raf kinase inhibitor-like protein [Paractinoplanes atraurantiacus]|uniref:Phospholipid-binding protein, PBP family n=1 Tax=Paractinoplanes atraurantiacus TaxID=1036182 RepID=A0A285GLH3_9ACTN|nr:YbhB/YbcL family Raf kinase inhibitor-like protein [Actinoplanes atraurantiacus]SNY24295.1 hypothetical protein SAMN05421748_102173 [Actinoplanes atraurantiacus]
MSNLTRPRKRILGSFVAAMIVALWAVPGDATASPTRFDPLRPRVVVAQRPALAPTIPSFAVDLPDIPPGATFRDTEVLAGFGCTGGNQSPALRWRGAPAGTKGFLVTLFDVDAPTSSGFWHWTVFNIPGTATSLPAGAGTPGNAGLPAPAVLARSDFGLSGYGGPCPPAGERPHRYTFTVVALDTADLQIPADLPTAAINVVMRTHALAMATRVVPYGR